MINTLVPLVNFDKRIIVSNPMIKKIADTVLTTVVMRPVSKIIPTVLTKVIVEKMKDAVRTMMCLCDNKSALSHNE